MHKIKLCVLLACCLLSFAFTAAPANAGYPEIMKDLDPHIRVSSYEVEDGVLSASQEFTLKLNVTNTNQYADACNILVNYYFPGQEGFTTVMGDTNQFYIEMLKAGETVPVRIRLQANDLYAGSAVIVSFEYKYYNTEGQPFTNVTHIAPKLVPKCEMIINGITIADRAEDGLKALLSVRYSNTSKAAISKIIMHIEGNIPEDQRVVELPTVEPDKQSMLDYYVTFLQPGEQKLNIYFAYEDSEGRQLTIEPQEYSAKLSPTLQVQASLLTNNVAESKKWIYLGFCCLTLFLAIALILVVIIKRKGR